ncbi:MAG TPA: hypothetical protein VHC19_05210 [Pirellulales bacterium]|jgi:hypothetical protein|nr:hypothetical protein [Pirellulales bacterium]
MTKNQWLALALPVALLGAWSLWREPAAAQDVQSLIVTDGTTRVSLKVQLEKGLRAMRPQDYAFLNVVLLQVEEGKLPRDLVEMSFLWARRQRAYRVQYFENVLRALAAREGVVFDTGDVSSFNSGFNQF